MNWIKYLVAAPLACIVLFNVWAYGNILSYRAIAPYRTSFMSMRMDELAAEKPDVALDYRWVPYPQISVNLKKALIASEDAGFAEHSGFDWNGIKNAMQRNERSGKIRAGGSTISQQLAKNLFLNESRSYFRKAEEAVLTSMLEATTDKDRLYELYLNVIEWGYGIYGAEAAAQHWHRKSAAELTKAQAAELAARVPRPLYYADHPRDAALKRKTNIILRRMGSAELPE
ncbi:monofunctional biosynthetic peptidoglycan transglycosylase [Kingella denitrificans]|jgi:monofunctional biosynthetic peptidoglycan transglycosylase|uniref:Biosynthetic peptidoglycan transglycosylase n=1 Tax=Kingella denitrificans ATCC 33394 TaxID=888741 RepID=F0EWC3_9NEIS|nr:monofunctional biosynthetic peptidoglycan transglycosylase [Kingella denitrificans]EGC18495.1 monofunctional biosynthetic peptidoglycan transglycosylase [Kingella denitrificans ATCC 33394]QQB42956.1 monofunctional biosynthetic peptidoglycan transglycosylase [Kingella denitrificans]RKW28751.1 MAG: monofunctional biosynthetic peptidoglycan transglycosylase [Kingella sp. (in: b-proteobacteria)]STR11063.1 Penicillin-binding protein 1A [Kingella denitrificans]